MHVQGPEVRTEKTRPYIPPMPQDAARQHARCTAVSHDCGVAAYDVRTASAGMTWSRTSVSS